MKNQSYTSSTDYKTVLELAKLISSNSDEHNVEPGTLDREPQTNIQRIAAAILRKELPARGKYFKVLVDDSLITYLLQFKHFMRLFQCVHRGKINHEYFSEIRVLRSDFIGWCTKEYIKPPAEWNVDNLQAKSVLHDLPEDDADGEGWYDELTDRRRKRVACLEIAKKLWDEDPSLSYEQVYNDAAMRRYGSPNVFSFESFKKWARRFSPEQAKEGGRPAKAK